MYHFFVNLTASNGQSKKRWKALKKILDQKHISYSLHLNHTSEEMAALVRKITDTKEEPAHLVIVGGDGTLNLVLQNIQDFTKTKLSILPAGSGNDFARNMKVSKNLGEALQHLLFSPTEHVLDYGEAYITLAEEETVQLIEAPVYRRFLYGSGIGYDADICVEVNESPLKRQLNRVGLGQLAYVLMGIKQVFSRTSCKASIRIDGEEKNLERLFFVTVMGHEYEGGGVPFCPQADPRDGYFDVCLVQDMPRIKVLLAILLVYFRKHYIFREVTAHRCKMMEIETDKPQWFHTDGEVLGPIKKVKYVNQTGLHVVT